MEQASRLLFPRREGSRDGGPTSHPRRSHGQRPGFTLLELLVVIAIIMVLAVLTTPAISNLQSSFHLAQSGALLQDQLHLARQLAIAANAPVIASFCQTTDASGNLAFNTLLLSRLGADGELETISRPLHLPAGFGISTNAEWSSLITIAEREVELPSGIVPCRQVRFGASGSTDLPPSGQWFLTVHHTQSEPEPDANFITLALDPLTGRVFSYQP